MILRLLDRVKEELATTYGVDAPEEDIDRYIAELNEGVDTPYSDDCNDGDVKVIAELYYIERVE